jgi:hypothetical protein
VEQPSASDTASKDPRRNPTQLLATNDAAELRTSRCGTRVIDAEQHLLQPGFVAHVLGQILITTSDNRNAAARAYAQSNPKKAPPQFAEMA